jgi:EAL domain-containing protein (putative c-di-GMP-specific phosphodiesterase class I)
MSSSLRLIAATPDMCEVLEGALADHGVKYHAEGKVVVVEDGSDAANADEAGVTGRVVSMLREVLSTPEREAVSVVEELNYPNEFPVTTRLEAWWAVFETSWFERARAAEAFSIWFQPIVDTTARRAIGYECLLRLTKGHKREGAEILAAASARRDLREFDAYTRRLAIGAAATQQCTDKMWFLNFLPSTMHRPGFCMRETMQFLRESALPAGNFVMEAVESNRNPDIAHLRRIGDYFREQGLGFALDDVAVNTEALRMVCELRPDCIKLEKQLAHRVGQPRDAAAVRKLVEVAERLGIRVVAKGVERVSSMEQLWAAGIQCMQGYLFGSPAPDVLRTELDLAHLTRAIQPSAQPDAAGFGGSDLPEVVRDDGVKPVTGGPHDTDMAAHMTGVQGDDAIASGPFVVISP